MAAIKYDWTLTDNIADPGKRGQPAQSGEYVVALADGHVRILLWDGEYWKTDRFMAPYEIEVVAWSPLPKPPVRKV
jgi:hypothetical protein